MHLLNKKSTLLKSLLLSIVFLPLLALAQSTPRQSTTVSTGLRQSTGGLPRLHQPFDAGWKFHLGDAADAAKDFNYRTASVFVKTGKAAGTAIAPDFDDRNWRTLSLPHDWAVELPFENSPDSLVMSHGYKPVGGHYPATSIGWYRKHFTVAAADSGGRFIIHFDGIYRDSKVWINGFYC